MSVAESQKAHYSPPWANTSIIGIAGSSGSGKTSLALEIVNRLSLPWVAILSMDSFYKTLSPEQSKKAFRNEYDFDSPSAIDFDVLVQRLHDLKQGRKAEIPVYSFEKHQRLTETTSIYSPHVLILEGIFALYDPRVLDLLDVKIFAEADADLCLSRRITRDVLERGRDIEGVVKQWFGYVKPNFKRYVEPQRNIADIIVPRGIENTVAIDMIVKHIQRTLNEKSQRHRAELQSLGKEVEDEPLSAHIHVLKQTPQLVAMNTIIQNSFTSQEDFVFYFDRLTTLLMERAFDSLTLEPKTVHTPQGHVYQGLQPTGDVSAVVILRAGGCFEAGLRRVVPDCQTGRLLIQSNYRTGEPQLHYLKLPGNISDHECVLILDPQMSSGGAALMAVRVLIDHGVPEEKIVFVTYLAGQLGLNRLVRVYPGIKVTVCHIVGDLEERWIEKRYFGC
ncbi:MAG: Uridine kinase [Cirrosporium novae-zelandiae]|nr:MAG: Uridine kinase [Cirrosporium novae-zelandiae]